MKYLLFIPAILFSACGSTSYVQLVKGEPGPTGETGASGNNGLNGVSCTVATLPPGDPSLPLGGAVISCNGNSVLVSNGVQGIQGQQGETGATGSQGIQGEQGVTGPTGSPGQAAYSITVVIDPCGKTGSYDEVLLGFGNGSLVALFTDNVHGDNPRFSLIPDGSYMTSDGTNCYFNVSTSGDSRTVSWSGGSQSWSY